MSPLLTDLQTKGLPDQTLVILGSEFGRTPRMNDKDGKYHDGEVVGPSREKALMER